jgi:indolepyruvate ferredoxin oxidoreductase alpha subunit
MRGSDALAQGAIEAGVSLVTGYPGAPATPVVDAILELTSPDQVRVEWTSNEKVALEMAFGASVGGMRSLLCVKSVGLNIALDPLMVINLSGCHAGLVILVGDDPGSWGSQNEQDSRILGLAAEIPVLEPTTVTDAREAIHGAFALSEEIGVPVMVRFTRALALARQELTSARTLPPLEPPPRYQREFMRWAVLPVNVVPHHRRLWKRLETVRARYELSTFNGNVGDGRQGVIAAGFAYQKLLDLLGDDSVPANLRILRLGTFHPLPNKLVTAFLQEVESVIVLEETAPLVERAVRAVAQSARLTLPVYGRDSDHIPVAGELFAPQIAAALNAVWPSLALPTDGASDRPRPSREPLCDGCPYHPTFDALVKVMAQRGGRDAFIVVGETGCMVRSQLPPYELIDVKNSLGSSIGMATGIALSKPGKQIVTLCGDSAFLHSGLNALVNAAQVGARFLLLILDNGTTALSGGQPHPASGADVRGQPRRAVDLAELARAAGVGRVVEVNLDAGEKIQDPIEQGLDFDGVAVVIARGRCPIWSGSNGATAGSIDKVGQQKSQRHQKP